VIVEGGVTGKLIPLADKPREVPPDDCVYQLIKPAEALALRLVEPPVQTDVGKAVADIGGSRLLVTVIVTDALALSQVL
jgi:hypothetical protein